MIIINNQQNWLVADNGKYGYISSKYGKIWVTMVPECKQELKISYCIQELKS